MLFLFPAPSVVPTNLTARLTTGTAVIVEWQIADLEPGFRLRRYVVFYRELVYGGNNKTLNTSSDVTQETLRGLNFFTTYEIKVAAATNFIGSYSEPVNVTTKEGGKTIIQLSRGNGEKKIQILKLHN